jgi:ATP-dependent Clp protease ATP-binding subunit ClpA
MFNLGPHADRFSDSGQQVIYRSAENARLRNQNFLSVEHILILLRDLEAELYAEVMQSIGVAPESISELLEEELAKIEPHGGKEMRTSDATKELFKIAMQLARSEGRQKIDSLDLFVSLFSDPASVPADILRRLGVDLDQARENIAQRVSLRRASVEMEESKVEKEGQRTGVLTDVSPAIENGESQAEKEGNDPVLTQTSPLTPEQQIIASGMPDEALEVALR